MLPKKCINEIVLQANDDADTQRQSKLCYVFTLLFIHLFVHVELERKVHEQVQCIFISTEQLVCVYMYTFIIHHSKTIQYAYMCMYTSIEH